MFRAGAKQGYRETPIKGCFATINEYCLCSFYITRTIYGLGMFINFIRGSGRHIRPECYICSLYRLVYLVVALYLYLYL